jgi:hypothetical protein
MISYLLGKILKVKIWYLFQNIVNAKWNKVNYEFPLFIPFHTFTRILSNWDTDREEGSVRTNIPVEEIDLVTSLCQHFKTLLMTLRNNIKSTL